jgi:hypothetical protein
LSTPTAASLIVGRLSIRSTRTGHQCTY